MNNPFIENGVLIRERLKNLLEKKTTTQNHEDFSGINDGSAFIESGGERNQV